MPGGTERGWDHFSVVGGEGFKREKRVLRTGMFGMQITAMPLPSIEYSGGLS